ncbi:hypothetical protein WG66_013814, partial [Moniliophthora roreri]
MTTGDPSQNRRVGSHLHLAYHLRSSQKMAVLQSTPTTLCDCRYEFVPSSQYNRHPPIPIDVFRSGRAPTEIERTEAIRFLDLEEKRRRSFGVMVNSSLIVFALWAKSKQRGICHFSRGLQVDEPSSLPSNEYPS